jgi:hypothetical protein
MARAAGEMIDTAALREHLGPNGPWAKESGGKVRKYRKERLDKTEAWLASHDRGRATRPA